MAVVGRRTMHTGKNFPHINDVFHYFHNKENLQSVCMSKEKQKTGVKCLRQQDTIKTMRRFIPPFYQQVKLKGHKVHFEIDSVTNDNLQQRGLDQD